ncbi:hypothetical protein BT69DRAFT_82540 [Atractiella rhizophila]|nr:hypothetical protein BT69DRAFT_82540 [Atractiella rhizophila]
MRHCSLHTPTPQYFTSVFSPPPTCPTRSVPTILNSPQPFIIASLCSSSKLQSSLSPIVSVLTSSSLTLFLSSTPSVTFLIVAISPSTAALEGGAQFLRICSNNRT